jgi:cytochrome bd-type quinol oxidase subunit 2
MISLEVYKLLHLIGLILLFFAFGGVLFFGLTKTELPKSLKKWASILHGIALFLILLGGFGMLARLGLAREWPTWVILKLVIWFILGGAMMLAKKKQNLSAQLAIVFILLGSTAAYLGLFKSF